MSNHKAVATGFIVGGVLFLAAAVLPLAQGGSVNVTRLVIAGALIVLAPIIAKMGSASAAKPPTPPTPPSA